MIEKSILPAHWEVVRLGDFAKTEKGKKPKAISKIKTEECSIPYVNIKAFEKNIIDEYTNGVGCVICEDNDFLMVWDGSRSGYVGKAVQGALGSTLVRIKFPVNVNYNYAYYFLQSKFVEINTRAKGVGIPHVDPNLVWNYQFPLPPLSEQQEIVAKIEELFSELDKGKEQLETSRQQLKVYRQAVLKWAFEGRFTNGIQNQKKIQQGELPESWKWVKMSEVAEIKRGKSKHRPRNAPELYGGNFPFIQTGDIRSVSGGILKKYTQTYSDLGLQQSKLWPKGTLCITIAANIGETAILDFDACFPDSVVGLLCKEEALLNKYCNYFFISFKSKLEKLAPATAQKNINVDILEKVKIPLPAIEEQHQIVQEIESRLSVCDKVEETISNSLQQAETLRQSILKQAFEGKLVKPEGTKVAEQVMQLTGSVAQPRQYRISSESNQV